MRQACRSVSMVSGWWLARFQFYLSLERKSLKVSNVVSAGRCKAGDHHVNVYGSYMGHCFMKHCACEVGTSSDGMSHYSTFARYCSGKMCARDE
jgi:hypothetical protein